MDRDWKWIIDEFLEEIEHPSLGLPPKVVQAAYAMACDCRDDGVATPLRAAPNGSGGVTFDFVQDEGVESMTISEVDGEVKYSMFVRRMA